MYNFKPVKISVKWVFRVLHLDLLPLYIARAPADCAPLMPGAGAMCAAAGRRRRPTMCPCRITDGTLTVMVRVVTCSKSRYLTALGTGFLQLNAA